MKKMLITGGSGLLGGNLALLWSQKYALTATYHEHKAILPAVDWLQIDLTKTESLAVLEAIRPEAIIHCAAQTNLEYCEDHPQEAFLQNVTAAANVATLAEMLNAYLIHISTDAVFDGTHGDYSEEDQANPINIYGHTKLAAEEEVARICPQAAIVRTNIYGWNLRAKTSLAEWLLANLREGKSIRGFTDVYFTPVLVNHLAEALTELLAQRPSGIFHIAGSEKINKFDFGQKLANIFGYDGTLVSPASVEEFGFKARRGKDLSLNIGKAERELQVRMPAIEEGLREFKEWYEQGYRDLLKRGSL